MLLLKPIWQVLKTDAGYEKTKLDELPLGRSESFVY